ncbi:LacI family transcriptional regulator [Rhodohalobacter sp. SW132]|uniref:LacI family DNA-binding transcriptional regulator n=1 Tax=Rhodohalobacter sp. SW132 TaxID=2293433 RepID=UPI000E281EB3|nr:LacI family DNA-binding transcriptional regulator [Rhodohalobacter sp. SW132]REL38116.1 LacI family transcriptional regulator [Rhodohalobacter sp. SW132]
MKVTLKDISENTGFSVSTISRAIRNKGRISDKNRKKIITSAQKLGYPLPEKRTRETESGKPNFALVTHFRTGEFYASFFVGFAEAAQKKGLRVGLFDVRPDLQEIEELFKDLKGLGYAGAVLFIPELKDFEYKEILENTSVDFPIISCSQIDNSVLDTVTFDAYQGAVMVAKHFYEQGYRSFGIIEGPYETPEARFRTNGFTDYLKSVPDAEKLWEFRGDYTHESGIRAFDDFIQLNKKPRAIFGANDAMVLGFIESLRKANLQIPDDVAIAGYDNLPICEYHYPKITSVKTDYSLLAENTFDNLISRLGSPDKHQGIVSLVPVSLEVRDSSLHYSENKVAQS